MKIRKGLRRLDERLDKSEISDETRRGVLGKIVAGTAAFAAGLFVSSRANAACNCDSYCTPGAGMCYSPQGLCYDDASGQYKYVYDLYFGTPYYQCCANVTSLACTDFCTPDALPC